MTQTLGYKYSFSEKFFALVIDVSAFTLLSGQSSFISPYMRECPTLPEFDLRTVKEKILQCSEFARYNVVTTK